MFGGLELRVMVKFSLGVRVSRMIRLGLMSGLGLGLVTY